MNREILSSFLQSRLPVRPPFGPPKCRNRFIGVGTKGAGSCPQQHSLQKRRRAIPGGRAVLMRAGARTPGFTSCELEPFPFFASVSPSLKKK